MPNKSGLISPSDWKREWKHKYFWWIGIIRIFRITCQNLKYIIYINYSSHKTLLGRRKIKFRLNLSIRNQKKKKKSKFGKRKRKWIISNIRKKIKKTHQLSYNNQWLKYLLKTQRNIRAVRYHSDYHHIKIHL